MDKALEELIGGPGEGSGTMDDFVGRMFSEDTPEEAAPEEVAPEDTPEEVAAEPEPEEEIVNDKAGDAFKRLKGELKEYKSRESDTLAKVEAAERRAQELEDRLRRAQELVGGDDFDESVSELKKRASVLDLENTQEWQQNVEQPLTHVMGSLKRLAEAYSIDEDSIHEVLMEKNLRKQGEKLEDLAADMNSRDKSALYRSLDDYQLVMDKKAELEADASTTLATIKENDRASRTRQEQEERQKVAAHADTLAAKLKEKLAGFEGDIDASLSGVKGTLAAGVSAESQAYAALSGTLLPKVYKALIEARAKEAEWRATVDKYRAGSPASKGEGKADTAKKPQSIMDIIDPSKPSQLLEGIFG